MSVQTALKQLIASPFETGPHAKLSKLSLTINAGFDKIRLCCLQWQLFNRELDMQKTQQQFDISLHSKHGRFIQSTRRCPAHIG